MGKKAWYFLVICGVGLAAGCGSGGGSYGGSGNGGVTYYACSGSTCVASSSGTFTTSNCNNTCGGSGTAGCTVTSAVMTTSVAIYDYYFSPACSKVNMGQTVTWTNDGYYTHTVTSSPGDAESFNSGDLTPGMTFSHTFTVTGTDGYYCAHHVASEGMTATVIVQ